MCTPDTYYYFPAPNVKGPLRSYSAIIPVATNGKLSVKVYAYLRGDPVGVYTISHDASEHAYRSVENTDDMTLYYLAVESQDIAQKLWDGGFIEEINNTDPEEWE